jgi:galacturan 1,4-alpha-galacturonidase
MQGTIKASTNLGKYKSDAWVEFYGVSGLRMSGGGTFDGQGAATWSQNSCSKQKNCQALPVVCIICIIRILCISLFLLQYLELKL